MDILAPLLSSLLAVSAQGQVPAYSGPMQTPGEVRSANFVPAANGQYRAGNDADNNTPPAVMTVPSSTPAALLLPPLAPPVPSAQQKSEPSAPSFSLDLRDKLDVPPETKGSAVAQVQVVAEPQSETPPLTHVHTAWPEVWGFGGAEATYGNRMAPNGVAYDPVFDLQGQINFGLLPNKKLYIFFDMDFFGQAAGSAVTSPTQGSFDFSKREWDFDIGLAWNYWDAMELRVSGFALNNLNRGNSLASPFGFNDGVFFENRYYFNNADKYDVGKLSFVSIGYMPASDSLIGQDGRTFSPGMTARAYLTYDLPMLRSYLYFDGQYISDNTFAPRLLEYDAGLAVRPWDHLQNLEFRVGGGGTYDTQYHYDRSIGYVSVRFQF